jgi:3-oxoacyl-[acyl-carrier protein] reductase
MSLAGKTALVTGSGRNIGRSIALALAREGADVVVNARSNRGEAEAVAAEVEELGQKALPLLADIGDRAQLEALLDQALDKFGGLDIVVNNAATRPHKPFAEMTYDDWRGVLAIDLDSAFITTKAALPGMMERGWGRVVNLSGLQAFQGRHGGAHISAAKVGLIGLTRALATELGPSGILVNCIVPGMIDTSRAGQSGTRPPARLAEIPVGRLGYTDDIASLCAFLCSDAAGFINGQTIHVNGGERDF